MTLPIAVIGSVNLDLVMKVSRLPSPGETVTGAEFTRAFGGKGANQAVAAARAGSHSVAFIGCVGEDGEGTRAIDALSADGIDVSATFRTPEAATGHAMIFVDGVGQNAIAVAPGANHRLEPAHIDRAADRIRASALVLIQCEIAKDTLLYALLLAKRMNIPVLWNFAPARELDRSALRQASALVVNESEAAALCGAPLRTPAEIQQAAVTLQAAGPEAVIITLGAQGAHARWGETEFRVPGFRVEAVDATGAGDVFCGALAVAMVEQKSPVEAVCFASAAAAISVTRLGAQPSAPRRADIDAFLAGV